MTIQANQSPGVSVFGATSAGGGGGGTPGGSSGQVQYNNGGSFGGMSGTTWDDTNRSLTLTGATVTTSQPVLNLSQTWDAGAETFTGLKFNAATGSSANSASGSLLLDLQLETTSKFKVDKIGNTTISNNSTTGVGCSIVGFAGNSLRIGLGTNLVPAGAGGDAGLYLSNNGKFYIHYNNSFNFLFDATSRTIGFSGGTYSGYDTFISRAAAATLQLGAADVSSGAVAQTLQVQSNTGAGTTGPNFTIKGSAGTTAGGSIIFQTAATTSFATALTINSSQQLILNSSSTATTPAITVGGTAGWYNRGGNWAYGGGGNQIVEIPGGAAGGLQVVSPYALCFGVTPASNPPDVYLYRDDADKLALRRPNSGATSYPQTFNIYGTYTDTNNYERVAIKANSTACFISNEAAGSGFVRGIQFQTGGLTGWTVTAARNFEAGADNQYDIGATSSGRPRDLYVAGTGTFGSSIYTNNGNNIFGAFGWYCGTGTTGFSLNRDTSGNACFFANRAATDAGFFVFGVSAAATFPALKRVSANLQVIAADNTASAGFIVGNQALATTATDGFIYVPTCAGTPTGTPTTQTGTAPIVVDTTNNKLYFYSGGAWRDAGP